MRHLEGQVSLSVSDLANHLSCPHLTALSLAAVTGRIKRPQFTDRATVVLQERGLQHETGYAEHLRSAGKTFVEIGGEGVTEAGAEKTREAMASGADVITQAHLISGRWRGRADFLGKVDRESELGGWSYEVQDTKLARKTKGGTILQLSLYSEIVGEIQGVQPERMYVVRPGTDFVPDEYRTAEYAAYYRYVKRRLEDAVADLGAEIETYPEPCAHCDVCDWRVECAKKRREDDHLSLVAGISRTQRQELVGQDVGTVKRLSEMEVPVPFKPKRGSAEGLARVREQARVQVEGREKQEHVHEILLVEEDRGFCRLPEPDAGDVFFDLEGDPFVGDGGREYLFGWAYLTPIGSGFDSAQPDDVQYASRWAWDAEEEKRAFEGFIDEMMERVEEYPNFHIYHYAPYEPAALKRLMGRYATREEEVDQLLRAGRFVDLYAVVRQAVRASVEKYSIKDLEPFFGFERKTDLNEANDQRHALEIELELENVDAITQEMRDVVESYNRDDCVSTWRLRNWLEALRAEEVARGTEIPRPELRSGELKEETSERQAEIRALMERIAGDVPVERGERTPEQHARWLLAQMMEWHHREEKAYWWEYYRIEELMPEEMMDERHCLAGLELTDDTGRIKRSALHTYRFPMQEASIREGTTLRTFEFNREPETVGTVVEIDTTHGTLSVKKTKKAESLHPACVFAHELIPSRPLQQALHRFGTWVAENGMEGDGPWRAARDLLMGVKPRIDGSGPLRVDGESTLDAARRLVLLLDRTALPLQGPPGSGKTYTGARMVVEAVRAGKKVGVTAVSHKVIQNLVTGIVEAGQEAGVDVRCVLKVSEVDERLADEIEQTTSNGRVDEAIAEDKADVSAGTVWLWAREAADDVLDVLFVDEAGQMALANLLAASRSAESIVLLGDPQQLEQPQQGSHPEGTDVSVLEHILGDGRKTLPEDEGLFLGETWRLHPEICSFTSELFYDGRLFPHQRLESQRLVGDGDYAGSGLIYLPVHHEGNTNSSPEEVDAIETLVGELTGGYEWVNVEGEASRLTMADILIVAPYNAQVDTLAERLPEARVGTVDRFQGQEAPVVVYSMTSSNPEDAPRGMSFLYSLNRLNVATSRARCRVILVANPGLLEVDCRTPEQMKLANAFCAYVEKAKAMQRG